MNLNKVKSFFADNTMSAALDNVLAMFPSTILMPIIINTSLGFEAFSVSLVLFMTGIGTLVYLAVTGGKLPCYLGSSFAFIGVSIYIASMVQTEMGVTDQNDIIAYISGAYLCSAVYLFILSALTKIGKNPSNERTKKIIDAIIPTAVMGPALSLIGLELSGSAVEQAGLNTGINIDSGLALLTIMLVLLLSVTHRPIFKKCSLFLGVAIAGIVAIGLGQWSLVPVAQAPIFQLPDFRFILPKFSVSTAIMVFPPTLILFSEHIGRKRMIEGLQSGFFEDKVTIVRVNQISLFRSVSANALATVFSAFIGGVPLTLYAENVAVMRINSDVRPNQYYVAAAIVILFSFSGNLLQLISSIPDPILGGLSLVLMGIIAAPGIKMLVDENVDYNKITNLLLTASVLISGLSEMSINIAGTEIKGMSLGLIVGIVLNGIFTLLKVLGISKEHLGFDELIAFSENLNLDEEIKNQITKRFYDNDTEVDFLVNGIKFITISNDFDEIRITVRTDEQDDECLLKFSHKQINGWIALEVNGTIKDIELKKLIQNSYRLALLSAS